MAGHRSVCIAGTHGKTSTTSMLTVALQHAGLDPSFAIGGELNESGSGAHAGAGDIFVAEADESDGSFLSFTPHGAVITNAGARPPRPSRQRRGLRRGVRRVRRPDRCRADSWWPASTTPGCARCSIGCAPRPAVSVCPGSSGTARRPMPICGCWTTRVTGTGGTAEVSRARRRCRRDRARGAGRAHARQRDRRAGRRHGVGRRPAGARRGPGRLLGSAAPVRVQGECVGDPGLRRLRPPPDRGGRDHRGGPRGGRSRAAGGGVPAASVLTDADLRRGVRGRAVGRRRGGGARRLRRARGSAAGGDRQVGGRCGPGRDRTGCTTCRRWRRRRRPSSPCCDPAIW